MIDLCCPELFYRTLNKKRTKPPVIDYLSFEKGRVAIQQLKYQRDQHKK